MIYQCPNCAAALVFDPDKGCMTCHSCDSAFRPEELNIEKIPKMMECHIHRCTACGAEVMVNDVEAATFCIYCGQPTVVFDRISSEQQPDFIIPFQVNKAAAEAIIRRALRKKIFVPKEVKDFKVETLRGIYVPFWLYNLKYHDVQYFNVQHRWSYYGLVEEAECDFRNMAVCASASLNMGEMESLEPFEFSDMVSFDAGYLSGFYADCYDENQDQILEQVKFRAQLRFDEEMEKAVYKSKITSFAMDVHRRRSPKSPDITVERVYYALMPVWFLTFRYQGEVFTVSVNGQTGKFAGNLPVKKSLAVLLFVFVALLFAVPNFVVGVMFYYSILYNPWLGIGGLAVSYGLFLTACLLVGNIGRWHLEEGMAFTKAKRTQEFVEERQEV